MLYTKLTDLGLSGWGIYDTDFITFHRIYRFSFPSYNILFPDFEINT